MTRTSDLAAAKACLTGLCGAEAPVLAAVSGGLDSMCLLHLLATWGRERNLNVAAAHFNHQLRGAESDRDERFVRDWCGAHEIPFVSGRGDVRALAARKRLSLEEAAREARYAFLNQQKTALGCRCVLTAHHADDNAETMLLNLLRGTGLRGLTGIPPEREDLLRPFLQVTRQELADYAGAHDVPYVEDSTNQMDDAARNVLLPSGSAGSAAAEPAGRGEYEPRGGAAAARMKKRWMLRRNGCWKKRRFPLVRRRSCPLDALVGQAEAVTGRAVQQLLSRVCGHRKDLTAAHVRDVLELKQGQLSLPYGVTVYRERDDLRFRRDPALPEERSLLPGETADFGDWRITLTTEPEQAGLAFSFPQGAALSVTVWHPRDRLNGRTVKRLCVDRGLSPEERDRLPVLRVNGQAAAAPGLGLDENFAPDRHETAAWVIFYKDRGENV